MFCLYCFSDSEFHLDVIRHDWVCVMDFFGRRISDTGLNFSQLICTRNFFFVNLSISVLSVFIVKLGDKS